jgi:hypothetical protein
VRLYRFLAEAKSCRAAFNGEKHFKRELCARKFLARGVLRLARAGVSYFYIIFRFCHSVFHLQNTAFRIKFNI